MTTPTRYFRADLALHGPLTDAQLEQLLAALLSAAEGIGAFVGGGWVETDETGEDLEPSDDPPQR
jgi:hypothetical protein